jgi:hypothetical protein
MEETTTPVEETTSTGLAPQEERTMAMLCHLSSLAGFIIPFGNIVGPLIFWLINKDKMPFVDEQGKEALNFQITVFIAAIISSILIIVVIGLLLVIAVAIAWIVFTIIASIKVNNGEHYRYPFALRLIK